MPARRRTGLWVTGVLGVVAVAGGTATMVSTGRHRPAPKPAAATTVETSALPDLVRLVGEGNSKALAELLKRTEIPHNTRPTALNAAEVAPLAAALHALQTGFLQFNAVGRVATQVITGRVLARAAVEPAPENWGALLQPAHEVLSSGLDDGNLDVRVAALSEVTRLWSWTPGRALIPGEEEMLGSWKHGFHAAVVRRLGDPEPQARVTAVYCLGELPVAGAAAPAVAYMDDPKSAEVRKQVLISFARRRSLISEEDVLRHLSDADPRVAEVAEVVLKIRGLTTEQISLGRMIFHPRADIRASVIPLLKNRTDIDPVVWLLQLSHDADESVRLGAVDALSVRMTPEVGQRLAEMARTDRSPAVRKSASRFLSESEKTAALPPLPGSPSLNPKAN
jgi:hypothetical protein